MRLGNNSIRPYTPDKQNEPAKTPAANAAVIDEYLKQYPHGIPLGGALPGLGPLTLGQPLQLAPKIEFHPLIASGFVANALAGNSFSGNGLLGSSLAGNSLLGNTSLYKPPISTPAILGVGAPAISLDPTTELISAFTEAVEERSASQVLWSAVDFAEALPDLPRGADIAVHVLGILKLTPGALKAFRKRGNFAEKSVALTKLAGAVASLITDCPGLEHGKPAAEIFAVVIKVGESVCTVPYQPVPAPPAKL
jgi:hypothetical protein